MNSGLSGLSSLTEGDVTSLIVLRSEVSLKQVMRGFVGSTRTLDPGFMLQNLKWSSLILSCLVKNNTSLQKHTLFLIVSAELCTGMII